jgi:hypothetical protein
LSIMSIWSPEDLREPRLRHFAGEGNYVTFLKSLRRDLCRRVSKAGRPLQAEQEKPARRAPAWPLDVAGRAPTLQFEEGLFVPSVEPHSGGGLQVRLVS